VDVGDLVAQAMGSVRAAASGKDIELSLEETSDCLVRGDAGRLQQVVWNLLSNAIKFTPAGGAVRVTVACDEGQVTVSVADTGVGIPPEFLPYVFDRFRQADQTSTRVYGGLGLGLSIVKHLVELHGGTVSVSSGGHGQGACFSVRLPATEQALTAASRVPPPPPADTSLIGRTILVVDDDAATRDVVSAALENVGADVRLADSAREAWNALNGGAPDLLVVDLAMPVEDGISFIRRVRRKSDGGRLPAIALSAFADARSEDLARAAGFSAFLAKPARPEALLHLIDRLLNAVDLR
jgi:CheY-like chemotaxis protein